MPRDRICMRWIAALNDDRIFKKMLLRQISNQHSNSPRNFERKSSLHFFSATRNNRDIKVFGWTNRSARQRDVQRCGALLLVRARIAVLPVFPGAKKRGKMLICVESYSAIEKRSKIEKFHWKNEKLRNFMVKLADLMSKRFFFRESEPVSCKSF